MTNESIIKNKIKIQLQKYLPHTGNGMVAQPDIKRLFSNSPAINGHILRMRVHMMN